MELLPAPETSMENRESGLHSLELVNLNMDDVLPEHPFGAEFGRLDNGLTYYVRSNSKPRMRAALALAVRVGSVLEENEERGVAHIIEHLAFSATTNYSNHDIVKFMESIGAEFGACQNAYTSPEETIYGLFVPVDKPGLLSQAISVLAEFSTEIRLTPEDLEKERRIVIEEYREKRNASRRLHDAHWILMMKGSKYAERLPLGLEKVIRTVSPETVKQFYKKWYNPQNMAVVAVGDFPDTQSVVELIKIHFGPKCSALDAPRIPNFLVPSHEEPRFSWSVDSEAPGSEVVVSFKMPVRELKTVEDFRYIFAEKMFFHALNQRFFKQSRKKDPPYFSCSAALDVPVRSSKAYIMTSSCKEKGTIGALESMLTEVARVRMHGFSDREIAIASASLMSEIESAYLQRDQEHSANWRNAFLLHFLRNEPVVGVEHKAKIYKNLLPHITAAEVSRYSEDFQTSSSCAIKITEPHATASVNAMKAVVLEINSLEKEKNISPWDDENIPEEIVNTMPNPGSVVQHFEHSNVAATELILSNGMRVCYKSTGLLKNQVLFKGFSYSGLSELPENEYFSCSMALKISVEVIGAYGYRPSVLMDMLAGKKAAVGLTVGTFMRTFFGECSPSDLETALQLVYQLFTTNLEPGEEDVSIVMQMAEESVHAQHRDPHTVLANRVEELNYGDSYFFRPMRISDLQKVDPLKACEYFSKCFKDPSTFTVVIVGNIDPATACPLILQYLGGIPRPPEPILSLDRDDLRGLSFAFPSTTIREEVRSPMMEAQCSAQLSFPVELKNENMMEDVQFTAYISKLLETKILQVLRFEHGQIYSVKVSVQLDHNKPSRVGNVRGDISINFSCDPEFSSKLVDLALTEVSRLQKEGPSNDDVSALLEIKQRANENVLQENAYWLERISRSYQSRNYSGNLGATILDEDKERIKVRKNLTPATAQLALQRIIPFPCTKRYTVVILMPRASRLKRLQSLIRFGKDHCVDAKFLAGIAGLAVLGLSLWRYSRSATRS